MSQFAAQSTAALIPEELLYGVDGAIATVTLNAPQRMNTISGPMLKQLAGALVRANEDPAVRVVILTGTGRAFCAGLNLEAQSKGTDNLSGGSGATPTNIDLRNTPPPVLHAMDKPVIAALNGSAAGYGLDLALGAAKDHGAVCQARGLLCQARAARVGWHLVPAADAGLCQGRRADLHRPDALRRPVAGHRPGQHGRTRR